jgi:hypothetical protein
VKDSTTGSTAYSSTWRRPRVGRQELESAQSQDTDGEHITYIGEHITHI